jgi:hypothetical protein
MIEDVRSRVADVAADLDRLSAQLEGSQAEKLPGLALCHAGVAIDRVHRQLARVADQFAKKMPAPGGLFPLHAATARTIILSSQAGYSGR